MTPAPTKPSEALRATRELLTPQGAWCRVFFAKDARGYRVDVKAPEACSWCLFGALEASTNFSSFFPAREFLLDATASESLMLWNDRDNQTQEQVLSALSRAIALAEEAGQ
jgi:hypothetical protein